MYGRMIICNLPVFRPLISRNLSSFESGFLLRYSYYLRYAYLILQSKSISSSQQRLVSTTTRYFLPVKIVNTTCDIFLPLSAFLFFCCVCVADQNTRALLLHAHCYCLAMRRLAVTHHPTYTQHEKREAKEKWQRRQTVENRTYGSKDTPLPIGECQVDFPLL